MTPPAKTPELADYPIVIALPVLWGDQDAFGHVNNTVPVRWFESARIAYLERVGLAHMMSTTGIGPILAMVKCDFRRQLNYPDTVHVGARVSRIGRTSLGMEHRILSERLGPPAAVEGDSIMVVFDYRTQRPVPVPADLRRAIAELEGREFGE